MARLRVVRNIPPPAEIFGAFKGFPPEESRQRTLLHEVRRASKKLQRSSPRPFYSMREIADHFEVPLRMVAIVYELLQQEGTLLRLWGSRTMLVGKKALPKTEVRGIVGIPISLDALLISPRERALQIELEERLRKEGYVADFIFFQADEDCSPDFAKRLEQHNLDMVLWQSPHPLSSHVLLSLRDQGMRQIMLQSVETQLSIPAQVYLQNWQPAYRRMAEVWQAEGISRILVPEPSRLPSRHALRSFSAVMGQRNIAVEAVPGNAEAILLKTKAERRREKWGLAFVDIGSADAICNGHPQAMEELMGISRVAFARGVVRIPYFSQRRLTADVIDFDPHEIGRRIVGDIAAAPRGAESILHTFVAEYRSGEPFLP